MTSEEIGVFVKEAPIAILPVGSIEQHGRHLPIDTDLNAIEYLAEAGLRAARAKAGIDVGIIAPGLAYGGPGLGMEGWPGTIVLKPTTLMDVVYDVSHCLVASGFRYVVVMNGCVGNIPALTLAVQKLKKEHLSKDFILVQGDWEVGDVIRRIRTSEPGGMGHACELETSISLILDPDHVQMDKAEAGRFYHPSNRITFDFDQPMPFFWPYEFRELAPNGVIGDPEQATAEKGKAIIEANIERIADILCHIIAVDVKRSSTMPGKYISD